MPNRKKLLESIAPWNNAPTAADAAVPSLVQAQARPATPEYITARQLCDRWGGISFTTLDRYIKNDEDMPRPVYFGARNRFFKVTAILTYEHKCEVRDAARALLAAEANND